MTIPPTLAAALRDATVEQLREDAALMGGMIACRVELLGLDGWAESWRRLAALALAVARMQERGFGVDAVWFGPDDPPVWFDTNTRPDEHSDVTTLPAALSALLEDAP